MTNPKKVYILPSQEADLRRLYFSEYKRRIKAGDLPPFAATMADLTQLKERNRILGGGIHDK
ncbi:MAG: hypothetical protein WC261_10565 [Synergistaceae bacterium]